jgi:pimeloyl-ACP methyl ester carboxylesterase
MSTLNLPPTAVSIVTTERLLLDAKLIGDFGLGDAKSRGVLNESALFGSRHIFGWHLPFRFTQPRDARALGGKRKAILLDLAVDVRGQAGSVTSPTLVINCAHDQIVTQTHELAASIPGSTYQQISAGHLAYFEGAEEFLSLATEFLRRHDA